ncbi:MAG: protein kinase, partial [Acidobacteria bacterium]|nr:protein kinase [Acidobacteriota bacterium]
MEGLEGKYEVLSKLKVGGMGAIYKVRHRLLDDIRVIKVMRHQVEQQGEFEERFRREARTAIRLHHDNIIQFYDFSVDREGNAFIVMEYIDGVNLLDLLKEHGPPPLGLTLEVARQSLKAVGYLHDKGIVHRDISPDNLMLTRDDRGNPRVKLIDLGVAKVVEGGGELTTTGIFIGKLKYCSPEQLRRDEGAEITRRSDLYSFAVVLYELLTGTLPIRGNNLTSIMAGHLFEPPVPFSESDPEGCVPEDLRRIVLKSLAKNPEARHESARHMARELAVVQARLPFAAADLDRYLAPVESGRKTGDAGVDLRGSGVPGADTPSGVPPGDGAASRKTPAAPKDRRDVPNRRRCEALFAEARRLAAEGHLAQAASQVHVVLQIDPESSAAMDLLRSIEEQRQARARESQRVQSLTSNLDLIARAIEAGDLERARESLAMARERFAADARIEELERRLEQAEEAAARERLEGIRVEARVLAEVYQFGPAVHLLEDALEQAPEDMVATLRRQMDEIRRAGELHRAQEEHEKVVAAEASAIEELLEAGRFDEARSALDDAESRLGAAEVLVALRERTDALEEQLRDAEVSRLLAEAREAVERRDFEAGIAALEAALRERPEDLFVLDVLESTRRQAREHATELERRQATQDLEGRVEELIAARRWDEGRRLIEEHAGRWPGSEDDVAGLVERLERGRTREEARRRAEELLDSAGEALEAGELVAALDALGDVRALDVDDDEVLARLGELDGCLRGELAAQQEARELAAAVERVTRCLAERDAEGARRALALAERQFHHAEAL